MDSEFSDATTRHLFETNNNQKLGGGKTEVSQKGFVPDCKMK